MFSKEKPLLLRTGKIIFFKVSRNVSSKLENKRFNYIVSLVNRNHDNLSITWTCSWFRIMEILAGGLLAVWTWRWYT